MNGGECTFGSQDGTGARTAGPEGGRGWGFRTLRFEGRGGQLDLGISKRVQGPKVKVFGNGVLLVRCKAVGKMR